ncbi:aldo/keto reductase [Melioribacter roseus P3M-2]|uniref:Aldo/keto reductase n=1 Tax=Melioribacter roseus (strain DSM 23840 / JCM 17771 / VKM B-2668 / P3M-2) TaxID=1191523 RepID=I6YUI7_MELRP|nr:aldo/keto reductase [Melioribacter roseus]AFN74227.1 aldo/keto reductase [Melioribacter roseus P3M-2]
MRYRELGRTGWKVSEVSFGAWAIGGSWGKVDDNDSIKALHKAVDMGVNFFDTADVYGDGRSERLLAKLRKEYKDKIYIATKAGRRLEPHTVEGYNRQNLTSFVERSLKNLETDSIDLLQLHCPPTPVYYMPEVFDILDDLVKEGKIKYYGVSVEKVEEGIKAIEYPNVQSVQIIYNMFRQRPAELFFELAKKKKVGILARVPLASGLLTGKMKPDTKFEPDDHRAFNRHGESFDKGETFAGIDYEVGLKAVEELKSVCPSGMTMAQFALRWILMNDAVTCAIPGAKSEKQALDNFASGDLPQLPDEIMSNIKEIYEKYIYNYVHHRW